MPLTFIEIEKQKSWRIGVLFIVLLSIYFCLMVVFTSAFLFIFPLHFLQSISFSYLCKPIYLFTMLAASLVIASVHFWFSASNAMEYVMRNLNASPPDPDDGIHKRLLNIMDEMHIATGNKKKIRCMVMPSLSMNALAAADFSGNAVIAITEGLLSRLTRPQLEAVMAHETYHVLSGDCIESTVATSLFGMYASATEKIKESMNAGMARFPFFIAAMLIFCFLLWLSQIINLFISREREYRADASAVRMTRNPLALAEALYLLSRNWKGIGFIGSGLEMLCFVNTQKDGADEAEGLFEGLMATHPPIRKRIRLLLNMAHASIRVLEPKPDENARQSDKTDKAEISYYALDPKHQWQGPYNLAGLSTLTWFAPQTWISSVQNQISERAWKNSLINSIFMKKLNQRVKGGTGMICPSCNQQLSSIYYEDTHVYQCSFCGGVLAENSKIPRIIVRGEKIYSERINSLAKAVMTDYQKKIATKTLEKYRKSIPPIQCPKCSSPMLRTFYSLAYLIEIDRCSICGNTWLDKDELEMLRCIISNKITATIDSKFIDTDKLKGLCEKNMS